MAGHKVEPTTKSPNHNWSGWPGAWCLDCGCEDTMDLYVCNRPIPENHPALRPCPCSGSGNHNPYKGEVEK